MLRLVKIQFSSVAQLCPTLLRHGQQHARPPCPSRTPRVYPNSCPSSQWCPPTISSSVIPLLLLPPIPPSIRGFSNESARRIRWSNYWSFSFRISPSSEYPGLISFRMDWLDLPVVQGTFKSFLQHHSSRISIFQCSAFFMVQFSHPYMTIGKSIALAIWTFVSKEMSLLFNTLRRLVTASLPRNKRLLVSRLQSPSAVTLEPKKIKAGHGFHCFPIYLPWSDVSGCHDLSFLNVEF